MLHYGVVNVFGNWCTRLAHGADDFVVEASVLPSVHGGCFQGRVVRVFPIRPVVAA